MALGLITNTSSSVAQRNLETTNKTLNSTLEKLSSGLRVNRASDDVAAMAIGSRLNAELEGLRTVATNAGQATSLMQIAEGAMARTNDILVRMKSLAAQSANGTLSNTERSLLDVEFQALISEVDRLALDTKFNGNAVVGQEQTFTQGAGTADFTASFQGTSTAAQAAVDVTVAGGAGVAKNFSVTFGGEDFATDHTGGSGDLEAEYINGSDVTQEQVTVVLASDTTDNKIVLRIDSGVTIAAGTEDVDINNGSAVAADENGFSTFDFRVGTGAVATEDVISTDITAITASQLGLDASDIGSVQKADAASVVIDGAIDYVVDARANLGAVQNRVETARTNLATTIENTEAAKSSYLDADIPSEITKFTAQQVLLQSGISTLAQANQIPQNLLSLFQ